MDKKRRIKQHTSRTLAGMHWSLVKGGSQLAAEAAADLDALVTGMTTVSTVSAKVANEQLREILRREPFIVVRAMRRHWTTFAMCPKGESIEEVPNLVSRQVEGILAWAQTGQARLRCRLAPGQYAHVSQHRLESPVS